MISLQETFVNDRLILHELAVKYGNSSLNGAAEVAWLTTRAERQIKLMEDDLEKGLKNGGANGGGVSRSAREHPEDRGADAPEGGAGGGGAAADGNRA